ncbi:hypothetical protein MMC28_001116 [Mycoblastus sanguinarius]|nr:hypothetical protein [Mycoblastus sanguinarius]
MPPAAKRQKTTATVKSNLNAPATQRDIQAFGKITKSQPQVFGKNVLGKGLSLSDPHGKCSLSNGGTKKRKLAPTLKNSDTEEAESTFTPEQAPITGKINSFAEISIKPPTAPIQAVIPRKKSLPRLRNIETPTKGARSSLESFALTSSSPLSYTSSPNGKYDETPPSSPILPESPLPKHRESQELPEELQELINLHSSFLTALTLHYAHNGSMIPADLRILTPGVERSWRKRRVTLDDVRRILALERRDHNGGHDGAYSLLLLDYGSGKTCVEIANTSCTQKIQRRPINEEALNARFAHNLKLQWTSYGRTHSPTPSPQAFVSTLPLLPITPCSSLSKVAPLLSKGQRRLEDLKAGAIKAQQRPLATTSANITSSHHPKAKQTASRSTDLFSRIKAKQLHQSTLPLPPSAEMLAKKSALQRLPEITPVLESLASSSKKHDNDDALRGGFRQQTSHSSFTMPTLVQHLQMSLRNPIGKEEAVRSVRLLAAVAPEWIGVKEVGTLVGVTIRGSGLGREEIGRRIAKKVEKL